MTTVRDIYDFLDSIAPFNTLPELADSDRSGLQTGDFAQEVRGAMVSLDVTPGVIEQAVQTGCDLIVSHHPVLFMARRQLLTHDPAWLLARHGISCIASHIPLDACAGGVSDTLAALLGLGDIASPDGLVRIGTLPDTMAAEAFAGFAARRLCARVRYCDAGRPIRRVAVCGGGGCQVLGEMVGRADAFLTGDAARHNFLEAAQQGLSLFAAGHFETEHPVVPVLAQRLREAFPAVEWRIAREGDEVRHAP